MKVLPWPLSIVAFSTALVACGGSVQVAVTDCPTDDIELSATTRVQGTVGQYNFTVAVTVLCAGQPVPGAELRFTNWYQDPVTLRTDANGIATFRDQVNADPRGQRVDVEIVGNDGSKAAHYTVN